MKKFLLLASLAMTPALAFASIIEPSPAMIAFANNINSVFTGALGVGLAVTMLIVGTAIGTAKCSPMPALAGVAGAAFLHWGPGLAMSLAGVPVPEQGAPVRKPAVVAKVAPATAPVSRSSGSATEQLK